MNNKKLLERILAGSKNIRFNDFVGLVNAFGFELQRVSGSHHIFARSDVPELLNLQNQKGEVKPYQIRQFLKLVEKYNLRMDK